MMRGWWVGLLIGLLLAPAARAEIKATPSHKPPRLEAVTLRIRHRVFHDFADEQRVKLNQEFIVGDTEFTARIVQYVPDFSMDLKSHKIVSLSPHPNNPAFKIIVRKSRVPQDTTWALLRMPPHFARKSLLAFQVARVDFVGRPPLFPDTTAAPTPAPAPAPMGKMP
jgi:hypothetical protein